MNISAFLVVLVGTGAALGVSSRLSRREARYAMAAFALHLLGSVGQWALDAYYYGFSDGGSYVKQGEDIAKLLDYDFARFAPEVARLALHLDSRLPFELLGEGSSSGTMAAMAGFFVFICGPSLLAVSLLTGFISWLGQLCWYQLAKDELGSDGETGALLGLMFLPSVIFWGSGFAKEALVLGALGVLGLSTYRVLHDRRLGYFAGIALGGIGVAILKAFTLFPFVLSVGAFIYANRAWKRDGVLRVRPFYLLLAGGLSLSAVLALGQAFPQYNAEHLEDTVMQQQQGWDPTVGGSTMRHLGNESTTGAEQLGLAPIALVNCLFRPFLFEAHGGPSIGAALETALLTIATAYVAFRPRTALRVLVREPFLVASTVFVIVFGFGVGLTTANLGSLSRYRVPMMPFYATILLVVGGRLRAAERTMSRPLRRLSRTGNRSAA